MVTTTNTDNSIIKLCRKRTRAELSQASSHVEEEEDDEATISTVVPKKRRISLVVAAVQKSVRFAVAATEIPVDAVSGPASWYTASDYAGFKGNMKRDVIYFAQRLLYCQQQQQAQSNNSNSQCCEELDKTEYCPLGLEKYCSSTADQIRAKHFKQQRIHAVLQQQALQKQQQQQLVSIATMGIDFVVPLYDSGEAIRKIASVMAQPVVDRAMIRAARLQESLLLL